jgi:CBS domain-containing protein
MAQVHEAMSVGVVTVAPDQPAWTAADLITRLSLTGLPVVDAERRVLGVITERDLIDALQRGDDLRGTAIADVMHGRPLFVEPDTDLRTAIELMEQWQVHRLPVCHAGQLVGVISRGDVLRALLAEQGYPQRPAP